MNEHIPRYLVPFHPKRIPHFFTDVLIIGGGLAGLRAAIAVDPKLSVLVVTKDELEQSNSRYAQGGIAGVLDAEDCFENHVADTMTAGGDLCDPQVVDMVVREGPQRIRELMQWGTHFDREAGELVLGREGGHSHHRIVHALGDATGKEVIRAVAEFTRKLRNVRIWENTFTLDLLTHAGRLPRGPDRRPAARQDAGLGQADDPGHRRRGQIYRETTNPAVATGDGHAMAYRAGPNCGTWNSCSSTPRCCTSPAAAAA